MRNLGLALDIAFDVFSELKEFTFLLPSLLLRALPKIKQKYIACQNNEQGLVSLLNNSTANVEGGKPRAVIIEGS